MRCCFDQSPPRSDFCYMSPPYPSSCFGLHPHEIERREERETVSHFGGVLKKNVTQEWVLGKQKGGPHKKGKAEKHAGEPTNAGKRAVNPREGRGETARPPPPRPLPPASPRPVPPHAFFPSCPGRHRFGGSRTRRFSRDRTRTTFEWMAADTQ